MMNEETKAQTYRLRARQLRTIAKELSSEKTRKALTSVAEQYERMAAGSEPQQEAISNPSEENKRPWAKRGFKSTR